VHRCRTTGCTPAAGETSGAADPDPEQPNALIRSRSHPAPSCRRVAARILADRAENGRPDGPLPPGHAATTARELTTRIHRRPGAVATPRPGGPSRHSGVDTVTVLTELGIPVP